MRDAVDDSRDPEAPVAASDALAADIAAVARIDAVPLILEVLCRVTGLGFSAVARVTEARWIACAVRDEIAFGLEPGGELAIETTICDEIRQSGRPVIIDHVAEDPRFRGHPTPQRYGFQSYVSFPIHRVDGRFFGTLCAIDPRPARVNSRHVIGMFKLFAQLIAMHLDAAERVEAGEQALRSERETAELREQFIAVLGHDLRNPLAAIHASSQLIERIAPEPRVRSATALVQRSVKRMTGLIDDILDFARGRLGGGIAVARTGEAQLESVLAQVIAELRTAWPDRIVEVDIRLARPVAGDGPRIGQLLSNLLANALAHGDAAAPVRVCARAERRFELVVSNRGEAIAPETLARLFQPFSRATTRRGQAGLGLGLYIAAEIARAHGGTLVAESSADETRFTFSTPLEPMPQGA